MVGEKKSINMFSIRLWFLIALDSCITFLYSKFKSMIRGIYLNIFG